MKSVKNDGTSAVTSDRSERMDKPANIDSTRRKVLLSSVFGAGWLGLRALATGLPISLLTGSRTAHADQTCDPAKAQYLVFATSGGGDPLNANVPSMYADPGIYHPLDPSMAPTAMTVGGQQYMAAKPWATLDPAIIARTCFFHHATYTNAHSDHPKVNRLMGAVKRQEMLISLLAKNLQTCLGTTQAQPVVIDPNLITYTGAVQPILSPPNLQAVLTSPTGVLGQLQTIRDTHLDQLNMLFKQSGTQAQRQLLDKHALSQTQVRSLSQQLLTDLSAIKGTTMTDLNIATAVLIKMGVSPCVVTRYGFGHDNHTDVGLAKETSETVASLTALGDLWTRLKAYGLQDKVTIAFQNVFGRTLSIKNNANSPDGRNHHAEHHVSVFIGAGFKSSIIGGVTLLASGKDYRAMGIDSATGTGNDSGDIPFENTLGSAGKTLGAGMGVSQAVLDDQITLGKVVNTALT
jgi:hypothetical protein